MVKTHLRPSLGHIMLNQLKRTHLQAYYTEKLKTLSPQSVLHHHRLLSKALNDAVDWEFIHKNVAKGSKPPKPTEPEMQTLSAEQLNLLNKTAKELRPIYFPIIYTAGHTGMRKSELMGLTWSNVDFSAQSIYVRKTITEANGKYFFNPSPKNKKGRSVKLTKGLKQLLAEHKKEYDRRKKVLGDTYNPLDLVFCNSTGNIAAPTEITRALKYALKAANLPNIRFHDLRHTHATILLKAGVHPKIASERLGHSTVAITLNKYSHVTQLALKNKL